MRLPTKLLLAALLSTLVLGCRTTPAPLEAASSSSVPLLKSTVRLASAEEGAALLRQADSFTRALGDFDRSLRMRRPAPVSDDELRAFVGAQTLDFSPEEAAAWQTTFETLAKALEGLDLGLPEEILVIKTTGKDELDAAYTRQNAIVLPPRMVALDDDGRLKLAAHELFHVASRASPARRDEYYGILGFRPLPAPLPLEDIEAWRERRVTNPDAHDVNHIVEVKSADSLHWVAPVLVSGVSLEEILAAEQWFSALQLKLLAVEPATGAAKRNAAGEPDLLDAEATDWAARVGKNTAYAIHPEEVMADNFKLLVLQRLGTPREVPHPEVNEALEAVLTPK